MPTKAEAIRWFESHVGQDLDTCTVKPTGAKWHPGFRTLAREGKTQYTLDGSRVINPRETDVEVRQCEPDVLVLRSWAGDTTYSPLPVTFH